MSVSVVILVGAFLLMVLLLASQLGASTDDDEDDEDDAHDEARRSLQERVERLMGLLNYGDTRSVEEATRKLLAMGPRALPELVSQLKRLEERPGAISPRCQALLEDLLVDFGLQTYLQCGAALSSTDPASPVFPAVVRVYTRLGPRVLVESTRGAPLDPLVLGAPLMSRYGERGLASLAELFQARSAQHLHLCLLALPRLAQDPAHAAQPLLRAAPVEHRARLAAALDILAPPTSADALARALAPLLGLGDADARALAAELCAQDTRGLVRALGRDPAPAFRLAASALVWAEWRARLPSLLELLACEPQEEAHAALGLLSPLLPLLRADDGRAGEPRAQDAIVALGRALELYKEAPELFLNALETCGPQGADPMRAFQEQHPHHAQRFLVGRRLQLLQMTQGKAP